MDQLWTFRPLTIDHAFKVPNQVMMHRERLNAKHLFKFKCQRRNFFFAQGSCSNLGPWHPLGECHRNGAKCFWCYDSSWGWQPMIESDSFDNKLWPFTLAGIQEWNFNPWLLSPSHWIMFLYGVGSSRFTALGGGTILWWTRLAFITNTHVSRPKKEVFNTKGFKLWFWTPSGSFWDECHQDSSETRVAEPGFSLCFKCCQKLSGAARTLSNIYSLIVWLIATFFPWQQCRGGISKCDECCWFSSQNLGWPDCLATIFFWWAPNLLYY